MNVRDQIAELRRQAHSCRMCGKPYQRCDDMFHCKGCYSVDPHVVGCDVPECQIADALEPLQSLYVKVMATETNYDVDTMASMVDEILKGLTLR